MQYESKQNRTTSLEQVDEDPRLLLLLREDLFQAALLEGLARAPLSPGVRHRQALAVVEGHGEGVAVVLPAQARLETPLKVLVQALPVSDRGGEGVANQSHVFLAHVAEKVALVRVVIPAVGLLARDAQLPARLFPVELCSVQLAVQKLRIRQQPLGLNSVLPPHNHRDHGQGLLCVDLRLRHQKL